MEKLILMFNDPLAAAFLPIIVKLITQSPETFNQALWVYLRTYLMGLFLKKFCT